MDKLVWLVNSFTAECFSLHSHQREQAVPRSRDPQLQVSENYSRMSNAF